MIIKKFHDNNKNELDPFEEENWNDNNDFDIDDFDIDEDFMISGRDIETHITFYIKIHDHDVRICLVYDDDGYTHLYIKDHNIPDEIDEILEEYWYEIKEKLINER